MSEHTRQLQLQITDQYVKLEKQIQFRKDIDKMISDAGVAKDLTALLLTHGIDIRPMYAEYVRTYNPNWESIIKYLNSDGGWNIG